MKASFSPHSRPDGEALAVQEPEDENPDVDLPELTQGQVHAINAALVRFRAKYGNLRFQQASFRAPWPLTKSQYEQYRQRAVDKWLAVMGRQGWELKSKVHVRGPYLAYGYRGDWQGLMQLDQREFRCKAAFQLKDENVKPAGFEVLVSKE